MKKCGILNSHLAKIVASMGHTDRLVICDCGLPIPKHSEIVDLALAPNIPRFLDTLDVILQELHVQEIFLAIELEQKNKKYYQEIISRLPQVIVHKLPHEDFKKLISSGGNISFVRTGETTSYANIVLVQESFSNKTIL